MTKKAVQLLFSHHPECNQYSNHVIIIGSLKFCIGCFIGYPSAFLAILLSSRYYSSLFFPPYLYFIVGAIMLSTQLLSFTSLTEQKNMKILQKVFMGFGAGIIIFTIYTRLTIILFFLILLSLGIPIGLMHYRNMKKTCNNCAFKWNQNYCPIEMCLADEKYAHKPFGILNFLQNGVKKKN